MMVIIDRAAACGEIIVKSVIAPRFAIQETATESRWIKLDRRSEAKVDSLKFRPGTTKSRVADRPACLPDPFRLFPNEKNHPYPSGSVTLGYAARNKVHDRSDLKGFF